MAEIYDLCSELLPRFGTNQVITYIANIYEWSGYSGFGWTSFSQGKNKVPFLQKASGIVIFRLDRLITSVIAQLIERGHQEL